MLNVIAGESCTRRRGSCSTWNHVTMCLVSCRATNRVQTVSPRARGSAWSGAGLHHQPAHVAPTFHHALHWAPPATTTSSNQEPSGELVTVHSLSPHLVRGLACRQNWHSCGRRQQHSGAIWSLFFIARRTDYVMHLWADCRRRTTNSAVTVTVRPTGNPLQWGARRGLLCWKNETINN